MVLRPRSSTLQPTSSVSSEHDVTEDCYLKLLLKHLRIESEGHIIPKELLWLILA